MATQNPTDAEVFQLFLAEQVATTGREKSPEELVRLWRERRREEAASLNVIAEGLADVDADQVHSFSEVNDEIRKKHGWSQTQ